MLSRLSKRATGEVLAYALFAAVILSLPLFFEVFWLNRLSKYLVYGMLGVAIALSWGYAGILNLGQGLLFAAGAYMFGMSMKLNSYTSQQASGSGPIPDFMMWNSEPGAPMELCCITPGSFIWIPFESPLFGIVMAIALPVAIAAGLGAALFRLRVSGVYVAIVTLALMLLVRLLVVDAQPITNGFNGLTDLAYLSVFGFELDPYRVPTFYVVAGSLLAVLVLARLLVGSRAGLTLQATRDDANRARYLGYDVANYQIFFFAASGAIAGYAGMLYVVVAEFASPSFLEISFSVGMVVWAAVGGRRSLLGACIGAILISLIGALASETDALQQAWQAILGLIFILVVVFLPRGLAGAANDIWTRLPFGRSAEAGEDSMEQKA